MMHLVHLVHEIRNRQLQLVHPHPTGFAARRKAMARSEVKQDIGSLGDDQLAGPEKRRRKRRARKLWIIQKALHRRHTASGAPRDVYIACTRLFQGEPDEFASTRNGRPVIKFIAHRYLLKVVTLKDVTLVTVVA